MKKLFVLTVVIPFFSATLAFAQPWGGVMGPRYGSPYIGSSLKLTQEQADKLQKMQESYLREIMPLQNRLLTKRAEMRLLWEEMNPDRDKIMAKQREVNEIQRQLEEKAITHRLELQAVLTPEQRTRMIDCGSGGGWDRGPVGKMRGGW